MNIKVRIYLISRFCAYVVTTKNKQEITGAILVFGY